MANLFPFQIQAARVLSGKERFGLFDEMGLGKTATTIHTLDLAAAKRGIVICPAALRANWAKEFRMWSVERRRIVCGFKTYDFVAWYKGQFDILITSYAMMTKWMTLYQDIMFIDFLVFDEFHMLKTHDSQRTLKLLGQNADGMYALLSRALRVYSLTGTPMTNCVSDLYTFLRVQRSLKQTYFQFINQYFDKVGRLRLRPERVEEIKGLLAVNCVRRTIEDVGIQIPPMFMTQLNIDGNDKEIKRLLAEHPNLGNQVIANIAEGRSPDFDVGGHVATLRRLIGEAKVIPYAEHLISELAPRVGFDGVVTLEKIVVFCMHLNVIAYLSEKLTQRGIGHLVFHGGVSNKAREEAPERFNSDPRCQVFIGQIQAGGVGITLTGANRLDMLEMDWTPAGNSQAIGRIRRTGQKRNQFIRFIGLSDSFDEVVTDLVLRKTQAICSIAPKGMHAPPPPRSA